MFWPEWPHQRAVAFSIVGELCHVREARLSLDCARVKELPMV